MKTSPALIFLPLLALATPAPVSNGSVETDTWCQITSTLEICRPQPQTSSGIVRHIKINEWFVVRCLRMGELVGDTAYVSSNVSIPAQPLDAPFSLANLW